jgi:PAS domain S-box-containing protein
LRNWIIGKRDEDYCILKNKSFSIAEGRRNLFNNVIRSKESSEWEENMIDRDGNEQYLLRRMYPVIDEKGDVTLVIGYGIDITERKKIEYALKANEEKYRGIISNINLGLMEVDTEQNIEFANETLIKMLGKNYQDVIGKKVDSFLTEEGKKTLKQRIGNRKKGISEAYEILVKIGNQKKWWLASSAPRIKDEKIVGAMVVFLDINHRKELEKQLHDSREQALHLAKTKEAFLANMSHEIRTPMNALIGMGNQLAKTQLDDKQHFYLNTINNAAENLLVIINDILDLSKIEAGKLSLEKIDFELNDVLLRAMNVMMHKAEEKGLYFVNSYLDSRLLNVLIGDPYRLNQILLNLISNSIKFTEKGKIDIRCELLSENKTTQKIKIIVEDTGIGMSESFSKILFQKFTQEEESATRKYGGTGLGMSICRDLVELMNGKIYAESIKDIGTKISLEITFKKGKQKQKIKKDPVKNVLIDIKNVKVLIADDNQMNRLVAATILNNYECIIDEATNGEEVLKKITETNFDIILMDIQMPLLDGIATTKKIREQQNCIPIIALTAYAIKGDKENFVKAGMNDYLSKPFKEQELITVINKWTKKSQKKSTNKISNSKEEIKKISPTRELYNLQTLNDISRGNKEFVEQMIGIFCDQTPIAVTEIIENYLQKNLEKVAALAHKIKPSIDNLNIISLKQVVRDIEKLAKENIDNDTLKNHIANLDAVIKDVVLDMKKNVLKTSSS